VAEYYKSSSPAFSGLSNEHLRELARFWFDGGQRDPAPKSGIARLSDLRGRELIQLAEFLRMNTETLYRARASWQSTPSLQMAIMAALCEPGRWPEVLKPRLETAVSCLKQRR